MLSPQSSTCHAYFDVATLMRTSDLVSEKVWTDQCVTQAFPPKALVGVITLCAFGRVAHGCRRDTKSLM